MQKHTIRLHPLGKELKVNDQTPLTDLLHEFGTEFPCGGKGTCGKCRIRLLDGEIMVSDKQRERLDYFRLAPDERLACMSRCTGDLTLHIEQFDHLILADETTFEFVPGNGFGVAVDLGTSTIVAQLVDLATAGILAVETMVNPQVKFGADLISRIQSGLDGHAAEMTSLIRAAIGGMISRMLEQHPVVPEKVVLVGNTVMQRIFSGSDLSPLSSYPFRVDDLGLKTFTPSELNWGFEVSGELAFYPGLGSFVGSDILAGIAATGLYKKEKYTILVDLGTNGEIAIGNRERILCTSTAAGPAFEGANLSMGMHAVTGAISSVSLVDGKIVPITIGNSQPRGICGSALIDAVAVLRKTGQIGLFGEIESGEDWIPLSGKIGLTQKDIYEFILAKAAIATGIEILTGKLGAEESDIDEIYIAGGFGNYINTENLLNTGMIESSAGKIHKMGNTALIGAKMFLFENDLPVQKILAKTTHINLEGTPDFQDIYISKMMLP